MVVTLGLKRLVSTAEWKVVVWLDGKLSEDNACYETTKENAVGSMLAMRYRFVQSGHTTAYTNTALNAIKEN